MLFRDFFILPPNLLSIWSHAEYILLMNNLENFIHSKCLDFQMLSFEVVLIFQFLGFFFYQLVLEAHNVPELSAGVNCTFEDLAEMNGLVEGNRIRCSSPAEKEMPRIIVDKGEGGSPAALLHKRNQLCGTHVRVQPPENLNQCCFFLFLFLFLLKFYATNSVKIICCHQPGSGPWNATLGKVL